MQSLELPYRILYGPCYSGSLLGRLQASPQIKTFNSQRHIWVTQIHQTVPLEADIYYDPREACFADILKQLPPDWEPDIVIWSCLAGTPLPPGIEESPFPTLAVVHDWPLNLQACLDYLDAFDFVVGDRAFLQMLQQQGFEHCAWWPCYAHDPMNHYLMPGLERVYDVTFAGKICYHYHRERNTWLERLSALADRYRIMISDQYYDQDYTRLLNQSKIVFNRSIRGEMNMRTYEAAACGALVFIEEDNLEIGDFLEDGVSCVLYNSDNLEHKLAHYLENPELRQQVAAAGVQAIARHTPERQFMRLMDIIPRAQAVFTARRQRPFQQAPPTHKALVQARQLSRMEPGRAVAVLQAAQQGPLNADDAESRLRLQAMQVAVGLYRFGNGTSLVELSPPTADELAQLQILTQAARDLPEGIWHCYNLACLQTRMQQFAPALELWQALLPELQQQPITPEQLSQVLFLPRGKEALHEMIYLWDSTCARVLTGAAEPQALNRLLLWQAWEHMGYCYAYLKAPEQAVQALLRAESYMPFPGSRFIYIPLIRLMQQLKYPLQDLAAVLQRAVAGLGLLEEFRRDEILALQQLQLPQLEERLSAYTRLISSCEGAAIPKSVPQTGMKSVMLWFALSLQRHLSWQTLNGPSENASAH